MPYYFATTLPVAFDEAVQRTTDALKAEGFGVITQIDVRATFKDKLGIDFRDYRILGACNPSLAHEALQLEDKVGAMLPCNVVVQALGPRQTEVAAIDPVASMHAIDNPQLKLAAAQVQARLKRVVEPAIAADPRSRPVSPSPRERRSAPGDADEAPEQGYGSASDAALDLTSRQVGGFAQPEAIATMSAPMSIRTQPYAPTAGNAVVATPKARPPAPPG